MATNVSHDSRADLERERGRERERERERVRARARARAHTHERDRETKCESLSLWDNVSQRGCVAECQRNQRKDEQVKNRVSFAKEGSLRIATEMSHDSRADLRGAPHSWSIPTYRTFSEKSFSSEALPLSEIFPHIHVVLQCFPKEVRRCAPTQSV